ncbi:MULTISPECIES: serine/threonine protein kinase [Deefgea]|uniref:HDOD domain-containing protein n=1 Tax=Deefgea chitinilytica TaxID=570276 RepID=A0ABS2CAR9_9NEIS|nr:MULTISPECIES: serine/threonine protein kinase [Deefgea]MBM5570760.1 HDOD domain-containing protein [Deefgea chitinilytica]MBM9887989.1 HDOD domain-containing protein [Deefgea sp. CFH1-16]
MKSFAQGRFVVERKIGQGGQGIVYLAKDTQLNRHVAIKVLHSQPLQTVNEAQVVSRLQHPNIVTLFDAFADYGHPCLVFEFVEGKTLAEQLKQNGLFTPVAAVKLLITILEGVYAAHQIGVVHRDIKPQNIIIDTTGRARIMDFGAAACAGSVSEEMIGTAGYMAPEVIANMPVGTQADVFACGVLLYQLLTGKLSAEGDSIYTILHRTANESVAAPSLSNSAIDAQLDHLVLVSLFKNPLERYVDAGAMRSALLGWLEQSGGHLTDSVDSQNKNSTLDFLLRRMRHSADFPSLSQTISAINKLSDVEGERLQNLSGVILQDFSLTNKLLKMVNSASYGQFGGSISTVSRAIVILGFDTVRNLAITLLLFEHMQNRGQAERLREAVLQGFFCGVLSRELGLKCGWKDVEEALICGMFQQMGRLLTLYYFHEESIEINKRQEQTQEAEHIAAEAVLGISYRELGISVVQSWNFPERIVTSMRELPTTVRAPQSQGERLRVFSNLAADLLPIVSMPASAGHHTLQKIIQRYNSALPWKERAYHDLLADAAKNYLSYLSILGISTRGSVFAKGLLSLAGVKESPVANIVDEDGLHDARRAASISPEQVAAASPAAMLAAGVQDITNTLVGEFKLNDLLRMILETMFRSIGFDHVLFCTRDAKSACMSARFGFGEDIDKILPKFQFKLEPVSDVFQLVMAKQADVFVEDINAESISQRIPTWYRELVPAQTLVVFPLLIDKKPVGLFYGDKKNAHELVIPHDQLNQLKTLRNQAILAIRHKQSGG